MEIKVKYHVDGKTFPTQQQAEEYIAANQDLIRVTAFSDYLRSHGQRGTSYMEERISLFLKFEAGEDPLGTAVASTQAAGEQEEDEADDVPPFDVTPVKAAEKEPEEATDADRQEAYDNAEEEVVEEEPQAEVPVAPKSQSLFARA